jgi:hypothetical protein
VHFVSSTVRCWTVIPLLCSYLSCVVDSILKPRDANNVFSWSRVVGPPHLVVSGIRLLHHHRIHRLVQQTRIFNQWLKSEDHGAGSEPQIGRLPPGDDIQSVSQEADPEISSAVYRLRREVEDAISFESNHAERTASRQPFHLSPSDAMKQTVREMYVPIRDHVCGS